MSCPTITPSRLDRRLRSRSEAPAAWIKNQPSTEVHSPPMSPTTTRHNPKPIITSPKACPRRAATIVARSKPASHHKPERSTRPPSSG